MKSKVITDKNGKQFIISHRKSAIFFSTDYEERQLRERYAFTPEGMKELYDYLTACANESWKNIELKLATSMGTDFAEYYDSELDNNGSLSIDSHGLFFERPTHTHDRLYKFNKSKLQSLLYDFREILQK